MQFDPADWTFDTNEDGFVEAFHDLEGCKEIIQLRRNDTLENIILELHRHQPDCKGYH